MLVTISSLLQGLIMNGWEYIEEVSLMITLLMVSAFCSAAETAYSAANRQKIEAMCEGKKYGAKLAGKLQDRFDDVLSSILIANTIVCIALSSVGAIVFGEIVGSDECGAAISGALLTVSILLFGKISPKLIAKESSEKNSLLSGFAALYHDFTVEAVVLDDRSLEIFFDENIKDFARKIIAVFFRRTTSNHTSKKQR